MDLSSTSAVPTSQPTQLKDSLPNIDLKENWRNIFQSASFKNKENGLDPVLIATLLRLSIEFNLENKHDDIQEVNLAMASYVEGFDQLEINKLNAQIGQALFENMKYEADMNGSKVAQYLIGSWYLKGSKVAEENRLNAIVYFNKSAAQEYPLAKNELGLLLTS